MFRKILIPLDGSTLAEKALPHVRQLAPPDTVELVLVNVIETYRYGFASTDVAAVDVMNYVRESAETYLHKQRTTLEAEQYTVEAYVIDGDAAQGILEVAETANADAIAMTTHGRSGMARWTLGSVAERVIHYAQQPVLLVREETRVIPPDELRRILVPLDGSERAEQALTPARTLATHSNAELILLRVEPRFERAESEMLFEDQSAAQEALTNWRSGAEEYLTDVRATLSSAGIATRTLIGRGEPGRAIIEAVSRENVDFLVMATRGRLGFDRLLHGSVAAEVLRTISCPLLLVRVAEEEQADSA